MIFPVSSLHQRFKSTKVHLKLHPQHLVSQIYNVKAIHYAGVAADDPCKGSIQACISLRSIAQKNPQCGSSRRRTLQGSIQACISLRSIAQKNPQCGGSPVRSKAQGLGPCFEGIRGFESLPPHLLIYLHYLIK